MRRSTLPFGGLQLVLTGDFCQLEGVNGDYCFKSETWSKLNLRTVYLHKQIRQDGDLEFQNMLYKLRYGNYCFEIDCIMSNIFDIFIDYLLNHISDI
jgi:ATP-dependent DNA helicase PIF1